MRSVVGVLASVIYIYFICFYVCFLSDLMVECLLLMSVDGSIRFSTRLLK